VCGNPAHGDMCAGRSVMGTLSANVQITCPALCQCASLAQPRFRANLCTVLPAFRRPSSLNANAQWYYRKRPAKGANDSPHLHQDIHWPRESGRNASFRSTFNGQAGGPAFLGHQADPTGSRRQARRDPGAPVPPSLRAARRLPQSRSLRLIFV